MPIDGGFRVRLPWGARDLACPVDWSSQPVEPVARSWLNRLHYMEYLEGLTAPLFETLVLDWIERNPLDTPSDLRSAWHPFAVSVRSVVWMQQIARWGDRLSSGFVDHAAASLAAQIRFVERRCETDLRGNHLVKNIKALLWASAFFHGRESERWQRLGRRLLAAELGEQILDDSTHYERSPSYHCQVMADLLDCHAALPDGPDKDRLARALVGMARAAILLTHPDGDVAQLNDCALHNAYSSRQCLDALARRLSPVEMPPEGPFALPAAGYFGDRRGGDYLIVDCGPVAPDYLIGHGHGDILSFEWSLDARRVIVDQGIYQNAAGPRRDATRGTGHHNTVAIDGLDQCDFYGAHRCGRRARVELLEWRPTESGFILIGSHDGYARLPGSPKHVRRLEASRGRLVIDDRLTGGQVRAAQAAYLLHPDCQVRLSGREASIRSGSVHVILSAPGPLRLEEAEWYPDLYVASPAKRLRIDLPWSGDGARTILARQE